MLKNRNRLKSKRAFNATYKNGIITNSKSITLYAGKKKSDNNCPTRVGFVVSKKIHKRAVKRNRIKRLMRECIRLMLKNNNSDINKYTSLILSARNDVLNKNYGDINKTISFLVSSLANKNI